MKGRSYRGETVAMDDRQPVDISPQQINDGYSFESTRNTEGGPESNASGLSNLPRPRYTTSYQSTSQMPLSSVARISRPAHKVGLPSVGVSGRRRAGPGQPAAQTAAVSGTRTPPTAAATWCTQPAWLQTNTSLIGGVAVDPFRGFAEGCQIELEALGNVRV